MQLPFAPPSARRNRTVHISPVIRRMNKLKQNFNILIHSITASRKGDFRWQVLTTLTRRMHLGFSLSLPPYLILHQKRFTVYFHYHSPAKVRLLDHRFCIFPLPLRSFHARAIYYFRLPLGMFFNKRIVKDILIMNAFTNLGTFLPREILY